MSLNFQPFYPINQLRNVALTQAVTPYVFLSDIDFMPASDLYEQLKRELQTHESMERKALVVAAFETRRFTSLLRCGSILEWAGVIG